MFRIIFDGFNYDISGVLFLSGILSMFFFSRVLMIFLIVLREENKKERF